MRSGRHVKSVTVKERHTSPPDISILKYWGLRIELKYIKKPRFQPTDDTNEKEDVALKERKQTNKQNKTKKQKLIILHLRHLFYVSILFRGKYVRQTKILSEVSMFS